MMSLWIKMRGYMSTTGKGWRGMDGGDVVHRGHTVNRRQGELQDTI